MQISPSPHCTCWFASNRASKLIAELYTAIQQAAQWFEHGSYNLAERFNHHAIWLNQQVEFEHTQGKLQGVFKASPMMVLYIIKTDQTNNFIKVAYVLAPNLKEIIILMKSLWLDIGNTCLKYWITENDQVLEHAAELHLQSPPIYS